MEDILEEIQKLKQRNGAYLKVLDEYFEPGRERTRKKDYYRGQNRALEIIEEFLKK
jgi:hypothetical protein